MSYFDQRDENNYFRLRDVLAELPDFCKEFFVGTQNSTSVLTRLNYAYDLRIFFDYLMSHHFGLKKNASELGSEPGNNFANFKGITLQDLEKLTALDLELFLDYLSSYTFRGRKFSCKESGKERKLSTLRSFFKYYFKKDKLISNIASKVDMPKIHEKSIVRLETDEIASLLDLVESESIEGFSKRQSEYLLRTKTRDLAIITLFLGTGIRISELVGLDKTDIDFRNLSFVVTRKGGSQSILYLTDEIAATIQKYILQLDMEIEGKTEFGRKIVDSPALFFSLQGKRISVKAVQDLVKKYSRQISPLKKITPHKLRTTFGTELYRNTHDIYIVADILGHKDINTTKKHYAAMSEDIRRAAAKTVVLRDSSTKKESEQNSKTDAEMCPNANSDDSAQRKPDKN